MKCPKCKTGELMLYKEVEVAYHFKITQGGKIYKHPMTATEQDTEKDYLECKNMNCNQYFKYELDDNGKIIKELLRER